MKMGAINNKDPTFKKRLEKHEILVVVILHVLEYILYFFTYLNKRLNHNANYSTKKIKKSFSLESC